jgi:hypothetical protein
MFADNMVSIEAWRATLPEAKRAAQNHPEVCLKHWRRAMKPAEAPRRRVTATKKNGGLRPVSWPQDAIRRAAAALRECRSSDLFVVARRVLEAAVPSRADLIALLDDEPTRPAAKAKVAPESAHA